MHVEGEDYLHEVGKDDAVFECGCNPDQIQWVLIDPDQVSQRGCVLIAEERAVVWLDADAEISDSYFEARGSDNVGYCRCHTWLDLCWVEDWWVSLVVEGYQEDIGYSR